MKVTLHSAFDHNAFTTFACQRTYKLNDWLIAECPPRRFPPPWSVEEEETCFIAPNSAAASILADA